VRSAQQVGDGWPRPWPCLANSDSYASLIGQERPHNSPGGHPRRRLGLPRTAPTKHDRHLGSPRRARGRSGAIQTKHWRLAPLSTVPLNLLALRWTSLSNMGRPTFIIRSRSTMFASLLACIPVDTRPELRMVHLRSGLTRRMHADGAEPDPFTGRPGFDIGGGIFLPPLLGDIAFEPCEIDLFGFVYDQTALKGPEVQLSLIWLQQAATLAHEVAHCWDHRARTRVIGGGSTTRSGLRSTPALRRQVAPRSGSPNIPRALPRSVESV